MLLKPKCLPKKGILNLFKKTGLNCEVLEFKISVKQIKNIFTITLNLSFLFCSFFKVDNVKFTYQPKCYNQVVTKFRSRWYNQFIIKMV